MKKTLSILISVLIVFNCCFLTCFAANAVSGDESVEKDLKKDKKDIIESADGWLQNYLEDESYDANEIFNNDRFIRLYSRGNGLFEKKTLNADDISQYIEEYNYDYYYYLPVIDRGTTIYLDIQGTVKLTEEEIENNRKSLSEEEILEITKEKPWRIVSSGGYPYVLDYKQELLDILEHNKIDNSVSYIFPINSMKIFMFAAVCLENGDVKFAILDYKVDGLQELINNNEKHTGREVEPLDGYEFPVDYRLYTFEEMKEMLSEDIEALEYIKQHPSMEITGSSVGNTNSAKADNTPSVIMQIVYSVSCAVIVVIVTAAVVFIFRKKSKSA